MFVFLAILIPDTNRNGKFARDQKITSETIHFFRIIACCLLSLQNVPVELNIFTQKSQKLSKLPNRVWKRMRKNFLNVLNNEVGNFNASLIQFDGPDAFVLAIAEALDEAIFFDLFTGLAEVAGVNAQIACQLCKSGLFQVSDLQQDANLLLGKVEFFAKIHAKIHAAAL